MVVPFGPKEWEKKKGLPFKKTIRETELTQNLPRALFICARVIVTSLCMAMTKRQDYDVTTTTYAEIDSPQTRICA